MPIATEITVKPQAFASAVAWAAKWVTARPVVPVHGGIALVVDASGVLEIQAFSEGVTARALVEFDAGTEAGWTERAIVSGRLLAELAGTLGAGKPVQIGGGEDGQSVTLTSGRFVATLPTLDEAQYPTLPGALPACGTVDGEAFARAVAAVAPATGVDVKPILFNAMHLAFVSDGTIQIMGTDRNRVAATGVPWRPGVAASFVATPLGATFAAAAESLAGPDPITVGCDGRLLSLTSPTRSLTMTTMDLVDPGTGEMTWPAKLLTANMAAESPASAGLNRGELLLPLKRAKIVRGKAGAVEISLADGTLFVGAAETEGRSKSDDAVDVDYDGPNWTIKFNPDYLADALRSAPGEAVRMHFSEPRRPVLFTCDADPEWRHMLMPIR